MEQQFAKALDAFNAGRIDEAAAVCLQLQRQAPSNPACSQLLALIFLQRRDFAAAQKQIQHSLALRPEHGAAILIAGRIARAQGKLADAASHFQHAGRLAPEAAEPAFLYACALLDLNHKGATLALRSLLRQHPQHAPGWHCLGLALKKENALEPALAAFENALALDAAMTTAHFQRANVLQALQRPGDAVNALRIARQLEPQAMEIGFNLGLALHQTGALELARDALEETVALAPAFADGWFNLGLVRQDQRDFEAASAAFRTALACRPDYAEAAVNLGIVLQESGAMAGAIDAYRCAMRLRPATFGRIAQAMTAASTGRLWLDIDALKVFLNA